MGKEKSGDDDTSRIKDENGDKFINQKERGDYVAGFYNNLYKKKIDTLTRIENFLGDNTMNSNNVLNRKLTGEESVSLEGEITLKELAAICLVKKIENVECIRLGQGFILYAAQILEICWALINIISQGNIPRWGTRENVSRTGLIKIIPKKGVAERIGDWRLGIK